MAIRQIVWNGPSANVPQDYAAAGISGSQLEEVQAVSTHLEEHGLEPDALVASLPTPEMRVGYVEAVYTKRVWREGHPPTWLSHPKSFTTAQLRFMSEQFADEAQFRATLRGYEGLLRPELDPHPSYLDRRDTRTETLVLYGAGDGIVGPNFTRRARVAFEHCVGPFVVDDCGHFVSWERSDVFNSAVISFCRDLLAGKASGR